MKRSLTGQGTEGAVAFGKPRAGTSRGVVAPEGPVPTLPSSAAPVPDTFLRWDRLTLLWLGVLGHFKQQPLVHPGFKGLQEGEPAC